MRLRCSLPFALTLPFVFCALLFTTGCEPSEPDVEDVEAMDDAAETDVPLVAVAQLSPTEGNAAQGAVTFTTTDDGARIDATITGLGEGEHGFHIHENGSCEAGEDGTPAGAAGGHYNPMDSPHAGPDNPASERHVGDMGNLEAGADGTATYGRVDEVITLEGPNSVVGKAVIIHSGADDFTSQPSGAAGSRIACGIIEMEGGM